jgi:hypothetical protein
MRHEVLLNFVVIEGVDARAPTCSINIRIVEFAIRHTILMKRKLIGSLFI